VGDHDVTEFNYRISDQNEAHILVGIGTRSEEDRQAMASVFRSAGLRALDLSDDELAKTHLRHMVGGRSAHAHDELLYRFEFPERPGALMRFLSGIPSQWNISLFHYRGIGADYGDVLVGIQAAWQDRDVLESYLTEVGFPFRCESDNPAYRLFL
jgi:threonine dehydratase